VVVFSGGGTGGHLYPALALAEALVIRRPDVRPYFVGALRGVEARVLPARGLEHLLLPARGVARGKGIAGWNVLPDLLRSLSRVRRLFRTLRPALVVVTGGYAGAPAGAIAALRGVPLALQEQNSVPGVTTRLLARFARQVHVAFPDTVGRLPASARARAQLTGNPVRPPVPLGRHAARAVFALPAEGTLVLIVGGSQGSLALNRAVLEAVRGVVEGRLPRPEGLQLLWSTGPAHLDATAAALAALGRPGWVREVAYIERMDAALASADLALSRAGAMATSEFLAWGLPAILVPLPTAAADHQTENARSLEAAGAALYLAESGLTGEALWRKVLAVAGDPARIRTMKESALALARPDAADRIAAELERLLPPARSGGSTSPGNGERGRAIGPGEGEEQE
jgi:UDP-N-acetylglucosamine--N-acetylmuramyl-(pentapeptide) pyrophosphoryl-undecaprenol N-acetylglucosamine transferase